MGNVQVTYATDLQRHLVKDILLVFFLNGGLLLLVIN